MNILAAVFPGQGSQRPGMGSDFDAASRVARMTFDEASEAVGLDLRVICFTRDQRLSRTEFAQPAILTTEIAMLRTLEAECGFRPTFFGGHSLGEYTALTAAGVVGFAEAVRLVRERGRRMQAAVAPGLGSMLAISGRMLNLLEIEACIDGLRVDIASINSSYQVVLSGVAAEVLRAGERLRALPNGRGMQQHLLDVSAPFHSRLMASVEPEFRQLLAAAASEWQVERAGVVTSNYTGGFHMMERSALVDSLTRQVSGRVRWLENTRIIAGLRPLRVIEIGPTSTLRGLMLQDRIRAESVTSFADRRVFGESHVE